MLPRDHSRFEVAQHRSSNRLVSHLQDLSCAASEAASGGWMHIADTKCVYIYIYIYYTYVHIYMYIYTQTAYII